MPTPVVALVSVVLALVVAVSVAYAARALWRRQVRRYLIGLVGSREDVRSQARALESVVEILAGAGDSTLVAFAQNPRTEERRTLADIAQRMTITAEELRTAALPKRLWTAANLLEAAARAVAREAGKAGEAPTPSAVLDALAAVDLTAPEGVALRASEELHRLCAEYGVEDPAVYGGGLYI